MSRGLESIKQGDALAVYGWMHHESFDKMNAGSCTPTIIYVEHRAFARKTGRERGETLGYHRPHIEAWTDPEHTEHAESIRREQAERMARRRLRDYPWSKVSLELANAILAMLDAKAIGK